MADFGIGEGIAAAGLAVSVAATAASVASAAQQAKVQQKSANYNSQVQTNNAQVSAWQRQQQEQEYAAQSLITQQEGAQAASRMEQQSGAIEARNIAAAASSGLQITGSTADVISGSAANNELAVLNEQHKTQIQAYQDQVGAANASYNSIIQGNRYDAEAGLYTMAGKNAAETGLFSEIGAGIAGGSKIITAASSANQTDLFGGGGNNSSNIQSAQTASLFDD